MSKQTGLTRFTASNDWTPDFDVYGPTMSEPLPDAERNVVFASGDTVVDRRELPDSGLSLSDITDWPSHGRERDRPDRIEHWAEQAAQYAKQPAEPDDARSTPRAVADGGVAAADFDSLDELGRGSVLTLDKLEGEFLIVDRKEVPLGTVQAIDVVDKNGHELRLQVVALDGDRYFDVLDGHETPVVKNTANIDDVRDFDVIRHDQEWLEEYLAETVPHFTP